MTPIVIIVSPVGSSRFDAFIDDAYVLTSTSPFIDVARILIERGADPDTPAVMRHRGSDYDAVWGKLGNVAGIGVRGNRITGSAGRAAAPYVRSVASQANPCCQTLKSRRRRRGLMPT